MSLLVRYGGRMMWSVMLSMIVARAGRKWFTGTILNARLIVMPPLLVQSIRQNHLYVVSMERCISSFLLRVLSHL